MKRFNSLKSECRLYLKSRFYKIELNLKLTSYYNIKNYSN